ncbi:MAG: septum site-determining protein MinD [Ruminococcaceae bacterium]|nr:septum site-determining protein MinD [Oscillospiraceae bacterium]
MGEVVVITSGKGGVGKTATTAGLGAALCMEGKSVVVIDADIGLRNLDVALGLEDKVVYDLVDVVEQNCRLRQALVRHTKYEKLYLLAASQTREKEDVSPEKMQMLCRELKENYDYILIDSPAGIGHGFSNAAAGADRAIVVTVPETAAVRDADRVIARLEEEGIESRSLVINRMRPALEAQGAILRTEEIIEWLGVPLLGIVPEDEAVLLQSARSGLVPEAAGSMAAQAYKNIAGRLGGREVPLMDMTGKKRRRFFFRKKIRK